MKITRDFLNGKVIDVHTHCGGINFTHYFLEAFPYCCTIRELILNMDNAKVDFSVTFPIPTNICTDISPMVDKLTREIIMNNEPCLYYLANRRLLIETNMYGRGRVLPFVIFSLYGDFERQIENINALIKEYDIYGVKIHTSADHTSLNRILENPTLFSFFQDLDLPIIIHSGFEEYSDAIEMCTVFEKLSKIRFCVAHAGRMKSQFLNKIDILDNVWIDISPLSHLSETLIGRSDDVVRLDYSNPLNMVNYLIERFPNKVLFGTDYPWVNCGYLEKYKNSQMGDDYQRCIDLLNVLPTDSIKKIANKNICDFLFGEVHG